MVSFIMTVLLIEKEKKMLLFVTCLYSNMTEYSLHKSLNRQPSP